MDLETLVSVCGGSTNDRKITCETLADNLHDAPNNSKIPDVAAPEDVPPDFPPESFWLSKDAEFDWFDRNAFLERKESTKGNSNSAPSNSNQNHSNPNSQRFVTNLKSKAGILGLPKTQKTTYVVDSKRRQCRAANIKLFPKRPDSVGKTPAISMTEPSSPKVSCMGRVRSKRGRKKPDGPVTDSKKPEDRTSKSPKTKKPVVDRERTGKTEKAGFLTRLTSMFRSDAQRRKGNKGTHKVNEPKEESVSRKSVETVNKAREFPVGSEAAAEPPSIGAMTRYVSGRRSESFGSVDIDVASRDSFDLGRRGV